MTGRIGWYGLVASGIVLLLAGCAGPSDSGSDTPGTSVRGAPTNSGTAPEPSGSAGRPTPAGSSQALLDTVRTRGSVRLILRLAVDHTPEADLPGPDAVRDQRARIADTRRRLLAELAPYHVDVIAQLERLPLLTVTVDESALRHLLGSPLVTTIQPDTPDSAYGRSELG